MGSARLMYAHPFANDPTRDRSRRLLAYFVGLVQGLAFAGAFCAFQLVTFN